MGVITRFIGVGIGLVGTLGLYDIVNEGNVIFQESLNRQEVVDSNTVRMAKKDSRTYNMMDYTIGSLFYLGLATVGGCMALGRDKN